MSNFTYIYNQSVNKAFIGWQVYDDKPAKKIPYFLPQKRIGLSGKNVIRVLQRSRKQYNTIGYFTFTQWENIVNHYCPNYICIRCHRQGFITPDHVLPVSKTGSHYIFNIQPLCDKCNSRPLFFIHFIFPLQPNL